MANEIVKTFSDQLTDKLVSVEGALPKEFNKTRFVQNALAVINEKPELAKINPAQLQLGLLKGAYLGLDFMTKECYLIPYGGSVQFQTSYIGEIKFTKRYAIRPIQDIYAKIVREGDVFEEKITDGKPSIDFKPLPFNKGAIVGVFAVALYKDGGLDYEVMSTDDINSVRKNYSKQANGSTWTKSWDEMAKKTCLRRLCKHIECDFESVEAAKAWEDGSDADFNRVKVERSDAVVDVFANDDVIDAEGKIIDAE